MNRFTRRHHLTRHSIIGSVVLVLFLVVMWIWACRAQTYVGPQAERIELTPYITKLSKYNNAEASEANVENIDDLGLAPEDYDIIYQQTGLGRA